MNNKVIALAMVGIMLSVCLVGVINYADNTDATDGAGTEDSPYILPSVDLSELKDKAVVYFNLSYDKQFVTADPVVSVGITYDGDHTDYLTAAGGTLKNYRYSNVLTAVKFDADVKATVKYTVTITYDLTGVDKVNDLTETVYYQASVLIHKATDNPTGISMEFQGNVAYNGNWALNDEGKYKGNEAGDATVIFGAENASFYSNNLPAGLYLKNVTDESGKVTGATIVGMLGSSVKAGEFDVYTITETDVLVTKVTYTVVDADKGNGFTYSVSDNGTEIINDASEGKTVLVKSGTDLTITTSVELTELKVTNATNGSAYKVVSHAENTNDYTIDGSTLSGTIKVFMTYNNGINDNRTIELTIIYIGSSSDASLVDPIVRSY